MALPPVRNLGLALGALFVVFGVIEVVTHLDDSAGALAFWGVSLVGGGAFVLAGTLLLPSRRTLGLTLLTIGAVVAANATLWTLLIPLLTIVTVVAAYRTDRSSA
jgi:hypothetical protein